MSSNSIFCFSFINQATNEIAQQSNIQQSYTQQPYTQQSAPQQPYTQQPMPQQPATQQSYTQQPNVQEKSIHPDVIVTKDNIASLTLPNSTVPIIYNNLSN
jgi:hypothetical protein